MCNFCRYGKNNYERLEVTMMMVQFIGLIVIECQCGEKFVVNSEMVGNGFICKCTCGKACGTNRHSRLITHIEKFNDGSMQYLHKETQREYYKPVGEAMPLAEYKRHLASFIVDGKTTRIKKEHKSTVSFDTDAVQIKKACEALVSIGYKETEAMSMLDVCLKEGLRQDGDIIRKLFSL
jgi:hypothetical protein